MIFAGGFNEECKRVKNGRETKPSVDQIHAQAMRLASSLSENQQRFLSAARTVGRDMEPAGPMAGVRR